MLYVVNSSEVNVYVGMHLAFLDRIVSHTKIPMRSNSAIYVLDRHAIMKLWYHKMNDKLAEAM